MAQHVTISDRLRAAGYDPARLDGKGLTPETIVPVTVTGQDGSLLSGIAYQTDYDSSQEYGIGDLRTAITTSNPRRFQMTEDARARITVFTDVTGFAVAKYAMPAPRSAWGDPVCRWGGPGRYASFYDQHLPYAQAHRSATDLRWDPMARLQKIAREVGVRPMPRRKVDLIAALIANETFNANYGGPQHPERYPAHFGDALVVRADAGAAQVAVAALVEAIDAGALAIGNYSGAFSSGLFLYDARDETEAVITAREEAFDWHDARMAELEPVAAELKERGHRWHYLARPTELSRDGSPRAVHYWLNGSSHYSLADGRYVLKQPAGWYTLDQLRAEAFLAGVTR